MRRRSPRRPLAGAIAFASAAAIFAAADVRSRTHPLEWAAVPGDLYGVRWATGQLQFYRGTHLVPRFEQPATDSKAGPLVPTIHRVDWDAPERDELPYSPGDHRHYARFRLAMHSWPPLTESASVLIGGEIAVPVAMADGTSVVEYREFGRRYDARAMAAWPLAAVPAMVAAWLGRRAWRASFLPGHCVACGYDLRASPERCPECGRPATPGLATR